MGRTVDGSIVTLSGYYNGYRINAKYTGLDVASNGTIGGLGVSATAAVTVDNFGTIASTGHNIGVHLHDGGAIYNFGRIAGFTQGVGVLGAVGTVGNAGTITATGSYVLGEPGGPGAAVYLQDGGTVTNFARITGAPDANTSVGIEGDAATVIINYAAGVISGYTGVHIAGGSIDNLGTIRGTESEAIYSSGVLTMTNSGLIAAGNEIPGEPGIRIAGGSIDNAGTIGGAAYEALYSSGVVTLTNSGLVTGGIAPAPDPFVIDLKGGGGITNTSAGTITGYNGITGADLTTIANGGTILGGPSFSPGGNCYAVLLKGLAVVTNGGASDTTALIQAGYAAEAGSAVAVQVSGLMSLLNYGTIVSERGRAVTFNAGTVTNGTTLDTAASINSSYGGQYGEAVVSTGNYYAAVKNFGTINGGVLLSDRGSVANAGTIEAAAKGLAGVQGTGSGVAVTNAGTIEGYQGGVLIAGTGSVTNADLIQTTSHYGYGVQLGGGVVINGAPTNLGATIFGYGGVEITGVGTLVNFGTLNAAGGGGHGAYLAGGGMVTNGSATDTTTLIAGATGLAMNGGGTLDNLGTIDGERGWAVSVGATDAVVNGSASDDAALISGLEGGVVALTGSTVINFGTITSTDGIGVEFEGAGSKLVIESHAVIEGRVIGGGGTLELAAGTGTLTGLGSRLGGFDRLLVDGGAAWTLAGASGIAAGETMIDGGTVILDGRLTNAAKGAIEFTADVRMSGSVGGAEVLNAGLIEKSDGLGAALIGVTIVNTGTISATVGTLDLAGGVTGAGTLRLAGAGTLGAAAVSGGQSVVFTGRNETLELSAPARFAAAIHGFGVGDRLDLTTWAPVKGEAVRFAANAKDTGGTLKLTDGSLSFSVALFGQYVAADFKVAGDGHGGSAVTYVPPPSPPPAPLAASA